MFFIKHKSKGTVMLGVCTHSFWHVRHINQSGHICDQSDYNIAPKSQK